MTKLNKFFLIILIISFVSFVAADNEIGFLDEIKVWGTFRSQGTQDLVKENDHIFRLYSLYRDLLPGYADIGVDLTLIHGETWKVSVIFDNKSFMTKAEGLWNQNPYFQSYIMGFQGSLDVTSFLTIFGGYTHKCLHAVDYQAIKGDWNKANLGFRLHKRFNKISLEGEFDYSRYYQDTVPVPLPWTKSYSIEGFSSYRFSKYLSAFISFDSIVKKRNFYQVFPFSMGYDEMHDFVRSSQKIGLILHSKIGKIFLGITNNQYDFGVPYKDDHQTRGLEFGFIYN